MQNFSQTVQIHQKVEDIKKEAQEKLQCELESTKCIYQKRLEQLHNGRQKNKILKIPRIIDLTFGSIQLRQLKMEKTKQLFKH
jgi:hypothetical protein